jgi:hypothetical protein
MIIDEIPLRVRYWHARTTFVVLRTLWYFLIKVKFESKKKFDVSGNASPGDFLIWMQR